MPGEVRIGCEKQFLHGQGFQTLEQAAQGGEVVESSSLEVLGRCVVDVGLGDVV